MFRLIGTWVLRWKRGFGRWVFTERARFTTERGRLISRRSFTGRLLTSTAMCRARTCWPAWKRKTRAAEVTEMLGWGGPVPSVNRPSRVSAVNPWHGGKPLRGGEPSAAPRLHNQVKVWVYATPFLLGVSHHFPRGLRWRRESLPIGSFFRTSSRRYSTDCHQTEPHRF